MFWFSSFVSRLAVIVTARSNRKDLVFFLLLFLFQPSAITTTFFTFCSSVLSFSGSLLLVLLLLLTFFLVLFGFSSDRSLPQFSSDTSASFIFSLIIQFINPDRLLSPTVHASFCFFFLDGENLVYYPKRLLFYCL